MKRYLAQAAYESLLRRANEYEEKDWERADRFERHAINAALDLRAERLLSALLLEALKEICEEALADGHDIPTEQAMEKGLAAIRQAGAGGR